MIKISDGYQLCQKKISRNKLLIDVFDDYQKLLDIEIAMKTDIKKFYYNQKELVLKANELEEAQSIEFTSERSDEIDQIMSRIGIYKVSHEITELIALAPDIKTNITHNAKTIEQLQELIPESRVITNYSIASNKN